MLLEVARVVGERRITLKVARDPRVVVEELGERRGVPAGRACAGRCGGDDEPERDGEDRRRQQTSKTRSTERHGKGGNAGEAAEDARAVASSVRRSAASGSKRSAALTSARCAARWRSASAARPRRRARRARMPSARQAPFG